MAGAGGLEPDQALEALERANDPIVLFDPAATIVWANDAVGLLGWTPSELVGRSGLELLQPADIERALMAMSAINQGFAPPSSAPYEVMARDGSPVECDVAGWMLGDPGSLEGIAVHLRPTQDSRVLRRLLRMLLAGDGGVAVLSEMLGLIYHRNHWVRVSVSFIDEDGASQVVGDRLDPMLTGAQVLSGSPWEEALAGGDEVVVEGLESLPDTVRDLARAQGLRDCWVVPVAPDGEHFATITVWVLDGGPPVRLDTYSVALLSQLIELVLRWRRQTRELERAATRDPLTGLPNRRALQDFDDAGPRRDLGVLYIDLDRFKPVNDQLGHAAGDQVLRTVATRLQSAVRPTDIVARLGGDEFGVICPGCSAAELSELASRVHGLITEPIAVQSDVVTIGASIGVAIGHDSARPLLEAADDALYGAKEAGRGTIRWAGSAR